MYRIVLFGFVVSIFVGAGTIVPSSSNEKANILAVSQSLDPIILGHTISDEHKKSWKLVSAKYHECGLCGEAQAYPGD